MDKNFLKDVIPSTHTNQKKSIRNIPLSENATRKAEMNSSDERFIPPTKRVIKRNRQMKYGTPWKKIILAVLVLAIVAYVSISFVNARAIITITPQSSERSIDLAYTIYNAANGAPVAEEEEVQESEEEEGEENETTPTPVSAAASIAIPYTLKEISVTQSKNVPASGEESVEDKARGTITVFNEFSEEPQQLITNTRFESPDGKIYRIQQGIVIPGMTKNASGATVPGTLNVEVVADQAGEEFNQTQTGISFTIPGLQNTPQYDTTYAKSTTTIGGGFAGVRKVVSEADETNTREELRGDLLGSIAAKIQEESTPEVFMTYNPEFIAYSSPNDTVTGESVTITERATVTALVFDMKTLGQAVGNDVLVSGADNNIIIKNISDLAINFEDAASFNPSSATSGVMRLVGDAQFAWNIDVEAIKTEIAGMSKAQLTEFLTKTEGVSRAKIAIKPFWKQSVPTNLEKIDIVEVAETPEE